MGLIGEETSGQYRSYHFDFRGSTVALTDETGQVTQRFQYAQYGELVSGDSSVTPFLFNGLYGVMTDDNGLYYMRARFYNPEIKRFINQDILLGSVVEGQTLNRFAYVAGNPISYVDPEGELGIFAGALIGISIWAITEIVLPTLFPPDIEEGSGEVIPSSLPDIVSGIAVATRTLAKGSCQIAKGLSQEGLAYELKHLNKHLPNTSQMEKLLLKGDSAHVFTNKSTLAQVERAIFERGRFSGNIRGWNRYVLKFSNPVGYRITQGGTKLPLYYAEMKVKDGLYHLIPRSKPTN